MAVGISLYTDIDLKTEGIFCPLGQASIVHPDGKPDLTRLSTWTRVGQYTYDYDNPSAKGIYYPIYRTYINAGSGVGLGTNGAIAVIGNANNWVTGNTPTIMDTITDAGASQTFDNAFFINALNYGQETEPDYRGIYLRFRGQQHQTSAGGVTTWHFSPSIQLGNYRAAPADEITTKSDRTAWKYYLSRDYEFYSDATGTTWDENSQFNEICAYNCNIEGHDFVMFVMGVSNGTTLHPTNNAVAMIIPAEYFKHKTPKPYVGPVSKDSAAAFTPTTPKRDSIGSRNLTGKKNPYGFNTGNGLKLLVLSAAQQSDIVKQIYTGLSGNDLNALGQVISGVVGGNSHRNAEELRAMIDAVLCCHIVPVITAGYAGAPVPLYTIAGYQLYNTARAIPAVTDQIVTYTTLGVYIAPIVNNFLTYAPYCTVSLSVPFVGDIPVDPSILFESSIYFTFYLDLYTGTLSVDVHAVADDGRDFIYTTRQTNCAVDIPIMGTGATGNPLQKIASAAGNVASSGVSGAPAAVFNIASAYNDMTHAVPVGRAGAANIAPYFSQRHCYLVIEYPQSANPENFFDLHGGVAELSGTVGSFTGYTEFSAVDVSGIAGATDAEKRQIEQILKGGVYL